MTTTAAPPRKASAPTVTPLRTQNTAKQAAEFNDAKSAINERRAQGVRGWAQLAAGILYMVPPLRADAAAVVLHTPAIATEAANVADEDERAAALLDRIASVGPYGALITAVAGLAVQLAVNHGLLKPGVMGSHDPDALMSAMMEDNADDNTSSA